MTSDEAFKKAFWEREKQRQNGDFSDDFTAGWKAALEWAKSGQEPVAWMYEHSGKMRVTFTDQRPIDEAHPNIPKSVSLYTHPAPAQPVRLTNEEIKVVCDTYGITKVMLSTGFANTIMDAMLTKGAAQPACGACPGDGSVCESKCRLKEESPARPAVVQPKNKVCFKCWGSGKRQIARHEFAPCKQCNGIGIVDQDATESAQPAVVQQLEKIALIAHHGGLVSLSERDALTLIRKLTINHQDWKMSFAETKAALKAVKG